MGSPFWNTPAGGPAGPLNAFALPAPDPRVTRLLWDDPGVLAVNSAFYVVGVHVYRSDASDRGPYYRVTPFPLGGTYFEDGPRLHRVERERIPWEGGWSLRGQSGSGERWVLRTREAIVVPGEFAPGQAPVYSSDAHDVAVWVDGTAVPVDRVFGRGHEIELALADDLDPVPSRTVTYPRPGPTSVVEASYFTTRGWTPSPSLETWTWYRVSTVAVDPRNPVAYLESNLDHCKPFSKLLVEETDYVWREAVRRNGWILQQGGERVKIFNRRINGIPCTCTRDARTLEYARQPEAMCLRCFPPGTLVRTIQGYRPIESIRVGDMVLTRDGSFHPVTKTFTNHYEGDLVALTSSVSTRPVLATPEHPFLTLRGAHKRPGGCGPKCDTYIRRGDGNARRPDVRLLPSGRWWARVSSGGRGAKRFALGTYATREKAIEAINLHRTATLPPGHDLKWAPASGLKKGDWLVARWPNGMQDLDSVEVPPEFRRQSRNGVNRLGPTRFQVDEEFLWVVGIYLAEGSGNRRTISFALHQKEREFQERLCRYFQGLGYHPRVLEGPGLGCVVLVNSTTLALWFSSWLGQGCANKRIPEELMRLPSGKTWALLRGIHDGDGSKRDREITQTSEVLALQLAELLHRMGEQPLLRRQRARTPTPKGNRRRLAFCVSWAEDTRLHANRKGRWRYEDEVLSRVRKVERVPYVGPVYNIEVDSDHTYVVNGVLTHNCYGTGFVGGYEGPYDTVIAPDDAPRRLARTPWGRHKEHSYDIFFGPVPLVRQGDLVVKQSGERYLIGPTHRPTNRGALLQQHTTLSFIDEGDVRYRVPTYGVLLPAPETRDVDIVEPRLPVTGEVSYDEEEGWAGPPFPVGPRHFVPMVTDDPAKPEGEQFRGRSRPWSNIMRGFFPFWVPLLWELHHGLHHAVSRFV